MGQRARIGNINGGTMVKKKEEGRSVTLGDALSDLLAADKEAKAEQIAAAEQAGPAAQQQPAVSSPTIDVSKIIYTAVERPFIDRLRILMPEATKNVIEEGRLWFDLRAAVKSVRGRFDVIYASLDVSHSRVYYAISQFEESRPINLPKEVVEFMDQHGFTVTPPAATDIDALTGDSYTVERLDEVLAEVKSMRKQAEKAFRPFEKGLSTDPATRQRQLNTICMKSLAASASQGPERDESELILRDVNGVFTHSYAREVGKPYSNKEGKFLGYYPVGDKTKDNLITVAAGQIDAREREWLKTFGGIFAPFEGVFGSPAVDGSKNFLLRYLHLGRGTKTLQALEAAPSDDTDELSRVAF
jgi:hypothetical protein